MARIALFALIVFALVFVVGSYGARRVGGSRRNPAERAPGGSIDSRSMSATPSASGLARWVAAGLLTDTQAKAIIEYEQQSRAPQPAPVVTPIVEAIAYVGGVLLAVGSGMLIARFWESIGTAGHLVGGAIVAIVTGGVGAIVGEQDAVTWRLRGFLWLLSAGAIGACAGLFVFEVLDRTGEPVAVSVAAAIALSSLLFWWLRDRPLQHLATFIATVVAVAVTIAWAGSANPSAWIGLSFWCIGATWAALAWARLIPPSIVGFLLGVVLTLVGSGVMGGRYDWLAPIVGLATALGWSAIGIATDEVLALAPGVVGVFVFLPWTLARFFGESFGAPFIMMVSGALLLGVVVVLLRRRRRSGTTIVRSAGHFRIALR